MTLKFSRNVNSAAGVSGKESLSLIANNWKSTVHHMRDLQRTASFLQVFSPRCSLGLIAIATLLCALRRRTNSVVKCVHRLSLLDIELQRQPRERNRSQPTGHSNKQFASQHGWYAGRRSKTSSSTHSLPQSIVGIGTNAMCSKQTFQCPFH